MGFPSGTMIALGSSVFAATADARFREGEFTLVEISLPAYGLAPAKTIRLSTSANWAGQAYLDPDGNRWFPLLSQHPSIDHGGSWLEVDYQPTDAVISIQDQRYSAQGLTETFSDLFATYVFTGAVVRIFQAFENLTSTSEFRRLFTGVVAENDGMDLEDIVLHCVEDRSWNRKLPRRVVTIDDFPDAPKTVQGAGLPIVIGDWETGNRYLDGGAGTDEAVYAGIARGAPPMICIASPTGTTAEFPEHLISDDEIDQGPLSGGAPYDQAYMFESAFDCLVGPIYGTLSNPTDGPARTRLLSTEVIAGAVIPIEVDVSNTAHDPEWCTRRDKAYNLGPGGSLLVHSTGNSKLALKMPDIQLPGRFVGVALRVWYKKPATTGTAIRIRLTHTPSGLYGETTINNLASSGGNAEDGYEDVKTIPYIGNIDNAISAWEEIKDCVLTVETRDNSQSITVHHVALNPQYIAQARVERPGTTRNVYRTYPKKYGVPGHQAQVTFRGEATSPDIVTFDSPLFSFPRGRKDTAAGIYTGTANSLIEHPVDIVRYLLRRWMNVSSGEFVETLGDVGSFADAKAALPGYKFRTLISSREDIAEHIADIGAECLTWFRRGPTEATDPWMATAYNVGATVNYRSAGDPFLFYRTRNHVVEGSFKVGSTKISLVANAVRVNYDWDPRTNTFGDQLYITPTGSRVHLIGDNFASDTTRVAAAAASAQLYGGPNAQESEIVVPLKMVTDPGTASDIMKRLFDLRVTTRLTVTFKTFVNAYDLNRGHVIGFASDWDARLRYPKPGSDGSWAGKPFQVVSVKRLSESPIQYEVQAVEI